MNCHSLILTKEKKEIKREQNNTSMETPNRITLTLKKNTDEFTTFKLPSIYYAVREENNERVCYIYSVMNKDNKKLTDGEYNMITMYRRELFLTFYDVEKHQSKRGLKIGYAVSLSTEQNYAGASYLDVNDIIMASSMCEKLYVILSYFP